MFKYVLKRIGYMFLVLFILSIVIFMIYNLTPSNRAYTDAKADQVAMKQQLAGMSAEAQAKCRRSGRRSGTRGTCLRRRRP